MQQSHAGRANEKDKSNQTKEELMQHTVNERVYEDITVATMRRTTVSIN